MTDITQEPEGRIQESRELVFFVSDLHGHKDRYEKLFRQVRKEEPAALFIGGDILPHFARFTAREDFLEDYLIPELREMKKMMGDRYPAIFIILGNDDPRLEEEAMVAAEEEGIWQYMHNRSAAFGLYTVYGYSYIPPTPFRLKDWERYDVSRYVDPGCIPPTEGIRTVDTGEDIEYCTIQKDLEALAGDHDLSRAIFLFHSPPYRTNLDRAALDGMMVDHVPLDVHVGSIAIRRFIEARRPLVSFHGHVHESSRISGHWRERINDTHAFNAAVDSKELSLVRLYLRDPSGAERILL